MLTTLLAWVCLRCRHPFLTRKAGAPPAMCPECHSVQVAFDGERAVRLAD